MKEPSNPTSVCASGQTRARWINTGSVYLSRPGSKPGTGQSCRFPFWEAVGFRGRLPRQRWLDWGHCATPLRHATSSAPRDESPRFTSVPSLPNLYLKHSVQAGSKRRAVTPGWLGPADTQGIPILQQKQGHGHWNKTFCSPGVRSSLFVLVLLQKKKNWSHS